MGTLFNKFIDEITLHSGSKSNFKIDCDFLTDDDIECLAFLVSKKYNFKEVIGIPRGGVRFAKSLGKYCKPKSKIILLVDDILTTGNSIVRKREEIAVSNSVIIGIVIFSRNKYSPKWVHPIFQVW